LKERKEGEEKIFVEQSVLANRNKREREGEEREERRGERVEDERKRESSFGVQHTRLIFLS
jgi:hypothetical protein|tara:strand:+ start:348 stop:530 length:183 start_codon:yes stop_codon:yes gene_type:complete